MITTQLATKLLNPDGSPASFDSGSRAILVPQLGKSIQFSIPYKDGENRLTLALRKYVSPTTPDVSRYNCP